MADLMFRIKVNNWKKQNEKHKDFYKKTPIANNFCTDSKLIGLPMVARWLYLGLLLLCGDSNKDTVSVGEGYLKLLAGNGIGYRKVLDRLQSIQLLSYASIDPLEVFNELNNKESNKAEDVPLEPAKDFSNISNPTMLSNIPLSKPAEFQEIEKALTSPNVFGTDFPPALRRGKNNFISRILVAYEFNTDDFKRDLTSIINESLLDKITDAGKSDYIATRVKKKALEVFNATR